MIALGQPVAVSVILLRLALPRRPRQQASLILANLPDLQEPLLAGSVVVFEEARVRIRRFGPEAQH